MCYSHHVAYRLILCDVFVLISMHGDPKVLEARKGSCEWENSENKRKKKKKRERKKKNNHFFC